MTDHTELLAACRELAKHLKTEKDVRDEKMARVPDAAEREEVLRRLYRTKSEELREYAATTLSEAEAIESRDAAIIRFRAALSALNEEDQ